MMRSVFLLTLTAGTLPLAAQYYRQPWERHHISASLGIAMPRADLQPLYSNAVGWGFGYGYRFLRNFQADVGLDMAYNAANVNDYLDTGVGFLRIRDFQYFIPVGVRAVLPLAKGRVELHGGGGWAYLRYSEALKQPSDYFKVECPSCTARDGFGYYTQVGVDFALARSHAFTLGVMSRLYQGHTQGAAVGQASDRTRAHWLNTSVVFSYNF